VGCILLCQGLPAKVSSPVLMASNQFKRMQNPSTPIWLDEQVCAHKNGAARYNRVTNTLGSDNKKSVFFG